MNFGLKKIINPHRKLSEFCAVFLNEIFPENKLVFTKDEEYIFFCEKKFPNCILKFNLSLTRDEQFLYHPDFKSLNNFGKPKIYVYCKIKSNNNESNFSYEEEPKKLSSKRFVEHLHINATFKEFHLFYSLMNSWNIIKEEESNAKDLYEKYIKAYQILTPFEHNSKSKFSIVPAIVRYNKQEREIYKKHYDFCLIVKYNLLDFISNGNPISTSEYYEVANDSNIYFLKFTSCFNNKEINRPIIMLDSIDRDFIEENTEGTYRYNSIIHTISMQSTKLNNIGFFKDLSENHTQKIYLTYMFGGNEHNFWLDRVEVKNILELWQVFTELTACTKYENYNWKD